MVGSASSWVIVVMGRRCAQRRPGASGEFPIYRGGVESEATLAEIAALLAVAQDHALGQPPGAQLRAAVLAQDLAVATHAGVDERETTWWTSALRFLGCTGHAFDMAVVF